MKLKRHLPALLSVIASAGVIFTAISSSKAALKAEKKTATKEKVICYIPTAVVAAGTILCIGGSHRLNRKQQASLIGMYTMLSNRFERYKKHLKDIYGEEAHEKVMDAVLKEECNPPDMWAPGLVGVSVLVPNNLGEEEVTRTFYDSFSRRYFESTLSKVMEAEMLVNRDYCLGADISVNDYYESLGLKGIAMGDRFIWDSASGFYWIDFNHRVVTLEDGMEVICIEYGFSPELQDL